MTGDQEHGFKDPVGLLQSKDQQSQGCSPTHAAIAGEEQTSVIPDYRS